MPLKGLRDISNAIERDGKYHYSYFFKPSLANPTIIGRYLDVSQSTGIPKFNAYVGDALTATPLVGSGNNGIYAGNSIPGTSKHLARIQALTTAATAPMNLMLLDYLMFYSLIDGDSTDEQTMDNTDSIPRYPHGQIMLVSTVAGTANGTGLLKYYNQDGVLKSVNFNLDLPYQYTISTTVVLGATDFCPFIPLASGDIGARSIESITFSTPPGGFFVAVIVNPLVSIPILEVGCTTEKQLPLQNGQAVEIKDGAYLNFIAKYGVVGLTSLRAELIFINS